MSLPTFVNHNQVPDKSIMDIFGRQTYLGNSFIVGIPTNNIGSTSEVPYALVINPSGSGLSMFNVLRRISIIVTGSAIATFRFYATPTVTANGTPLTPGNLRINAASKASVMKMYSLPTVSNNGTFIAEIGTTSSGNPYDSDVLTILDPGVTLLVTCQASSGTAPVGFETVWYEM